MHVVARFDAVEYLPAAQVVQVEAPSSEPVLVTEPGAQALQAESVDTADQ